MNEILLFIHSIQISYNKVIVCAEDVPRAVASVRQGGGANAPLNFGPEVQYFNEFLKKDYMLFVFIVIQNEKVFFFSVK